MYDRYQKVKFCTDIYKDVSSGLDIFSIIPMLTFYIHVVQILQFSPPSTPLILTISLYLFSPMCVYVLK